MDDVTAKGVVLAIDQGTTGTTCVLYGPDGRVHARAYRPLEQIYPAEGWVEHDPLEIWRGVVSAVRELTSVSPLPVVAAGITNQRETTVIWNRNTGEPVHNAIVWQCRRTSDICRRYEAERERIRAKTGLPLDAYFSATKIRWILERYRGLDSGQLLFGTIDTWLLWKLTGGKVHATDYTNASRTLLFDIREKQWDRELLELFGVPLSMLPEAGPSMGDFGSVSAISELQGVPVAAVAGDQQAALFGQCCFEPGMIKNTYGTGCFLVMHTGDRCIRSRNGLIATLAIDAGGVHATPSKDPCSSAVQLCSGFATNCSCSGMPPIPQRWPGPWRPVVASISSRPLPGLERRTGTWRCGARLQDLQGGRTGTISSGLHLSPLPIRRMTCSGPWRPTRAYLRSSCWLTAERSITGF